MFRRLKGGAMALLAWGFCWIGGALAQEASVPISFLPPPLESATYSLGIYETKSGKLVRTLQQSANESAFTVGLNGLITKWDRKDDAGKAVPPGKYAARGYAVGPLKVEGVAVHGNDWVSEDESLRVRHIEAIGYVPDDNGLVVLATLASGQQLIRLAGPDNAKILWRTPTAFPQIALPQSIGVGKPNDTGVGEANEIGIFLYPKLASTNGHSLTKQSVTSQGAGHYNLRDGSVNLGRSLGVEIEGHVPPVSPGESPKPLTLPEGYMESGGGKTGTDWYIVDGKALVQFSMPEAQPLRRLEAKPGEPPMRSVTASSKEDRLYLLEEMPGWQRVRGLSWVDTKDEGGKKVSTWETFFERNIRTPDPALGLEDPATAKAPSPIIELPLAKNELSPGKSAKAKLTAGFDAKGSYLETADGLRLRQISERANLQAVKLAKGKTPGSLAFFQTDGAAWDEFSIEGADKMMSFDAGEFELTATGEKPADAKSTEPDL